MDNTQNAVAIFNKLADVYQEKFMDVSLYHATLDIFCNAIQSKNPQILELACGPGNITKYLIGQRPDLQILGTDLAPNMIALAQTNNPGAAFQLLDCREIKNLNKHFDAIMCGFALPYLSEVEARQLIKDASEILTAGGVLYISTMEENEQQRSGIKKSSAGDEVYMYYHNAERLTDALKANGFTILDVRRIEYMTGDSKTTDFVVIAQKKES